MNNITAQKMKFSILNFFSKCDKIRRKPRIWSHLLKKSLTENLIFLCSVFNGQVSTGQFYPMVKCSMSTITTLEHKGWTTTGYI